MDNYTERLDGPDGQYIVLLTRLPNDRFALIEAQAFRESNLSVFTNVVLRALAWEASVKDYLTGEDAGGDLDRAAPEVTLPWRERAMDLYLEWKRQALPGPKGSTRKPGSRTRTTSKARTTPATTA